MYVLFAEDQPTWLSNKATSVELLLLTQIENGVDYFQTSAISSLFASGALDPLALGLFPVRQIRFQQRFGVADID